MLTASLEFGAGPEVVTWPMLLAGLGIGALASQLGSVTVSAVPDAQSAEVGGLQSTMTNLGASIGTALAGAVLISALTTSFLAGLQANSDVPDNLSSQAQVELAPGIPFIAESDLKPALEEAGVSGPVADAIVAENTQACLDGLRSALAVLALIALIALFFARGVLTQQPGAAQPDAGTTRTRPPLGPMGSRSQRLSNGSRPHP